MKFKNETNQFNVQLIIHIISKMLTEYNKGYKICVQSIRKSYASEFEFLILFGGLSTVSGLLSFLNIEKKE